MIAFERPKASGKLSVIVRGQRQPGTSYNSDKYKVLAAERSNVLEAEDELVQREPTPEEMRAAKNRAKRDRRSRR